MSRSAVMTKDILPAIERSGLFKTVKPLKASNIGAGPTILAKDSKGIVYHFNVVESSRAFNKNTLHSSGIVFKHGEQLFLWLRAQLEAMPTEHIPLSRISEGLALV